MGCLDDDFDVELENSVKLGFLNLGFEAEPETIAIEDAVKVLLQGLDEDINREGLKKTPLRVAKALREGTRGYKQNVKDIVEGALFPEAGLANGVGHGGGAGGIVDVQDVDLFSYCESCLLPFQVKCHIGYVPSGQRVVGLSKLPRVADVFAKRLQDPQRLADEVCSALYHSVKPAGVAVMLQCSHIQFPNLESVFLDSNHQGWVKMLVSSGSGVFENENADIWGDFLSLLDLEGVNVDNTCTTNSTRQCWCPCQSSSSAKISSKFGPAEQAMVAAVASLLRSLGEDPLREELVGTPSRFVKWFMKFQKANLEMKLNGFASGKINLLRPNGEVCRNKEHMYYELDLSVWSQCEHHLLPFYGVVHIGYFCAEGSIPIGRSLLQSIVHFYGSKLQVQERLTRQILETVSSFVGGGVIVLVWAKHTCMICRGIEKVGSSTKTPQWQGRFSTDHKARIQFYNSIPKTFPSGGW